MKDLNAEQDEFLFEICNELLEVDQFNWENRISETQSRFFSKFEFEPSLETVEKYYYNTIHQGV